MTKILRHHDTSRSADNLTGHVHCQGMILWALIVASVVPAIGHTAPSVPRDETKEIHIRYNRRNLASPAAARNLFHRIDAAALEVCGASSFSLAELKLATRASSCWRTAVAGAVRRIDSAMLTTVANHSPTEYADRLVHYQ